MTYLILPNCSNFWLSFKVAFYGSWKQRVHFEICTEESFLECAKQSINLLWIPPTHKKWHFIMSKYWMLTGSFTSLKNTNICIHENQIRGGSELKTKGWGFVTWTYLVTARKRHQPSWAVLERGFKPVLFVIQVGRKWTFLSIRYLQDTVTR